MPSLVASIETILMSLPGTRPAALIASSAPRPMSSFCANSRLIVLPYFCRKPSMTVLPSARVKLPVCESSVVIGAPCDALA